MDVVKKTGIGRKEVPENAHKAKTISERDRRLMRWIGTNGVASFKQLHTVFWTTATERTCRERLAQLEKAGWLERHYVYTTRKRGEQVYTLTRRAATEHFEAATRKRLMIGLPASSELKQQLTAQDTRIALERTLAAQGKHIVNWLNERELRREAASLQRKAGSRAWGGLADVADARIYIGTCKPGLQASNGEAFDPSRTTGVVAAAPSLYKAVSNKLAMYLPITDSYESYGEAVQRVDVEIDGPYYGQMLKSKIRGIARRNQPTLWITTSDRIDRIQSEINHAGTSNIRVMAIDPIV